ncbi:TonB-dependent receptor [Altererythrobacter salegens]|uniref:TonB-dependent receptor n=1 Tax=Croceibacterium salegens TaxID=1737568 RepID=A0A6I4T1I5_9SPHN|nr:TonB-dependent receptor [Croceibacterium salegens]MXO61180.1 TonB-dependent receptor [Croceibacterium salegens]
MIRSLYVALAAGAALVASTAHAESVRVDVPAGRAADSAIAIAKQTGTSIVITDPDVANRSVNAIRGTMDAGEAVRRLARLADARAVAAGSYGWRLVPAPQSRRSAPGATPPPRAAHATPTPAPGEVAEVEGTPIIVEASKRDLSLGDFPGQVSMLDGKALELGGTGGTEKITQRLATVSSTHLGSGRNKLFIRGIADSSFTGPTQATVGQYFSDLRLSYNAPDPDLRLSDLDRVEVLEGPQGTLYGAGSLGGIIRLVPNTPDAGFTAAFGQVGVGYTQHGAASVDGTATFNLPIVGDLAALRVTVDAASQGGYIDKPLLGRDNVNRTDLVGGRAMVRVELAPSWQVDLIGLAQSTDSADSQYADRRGPPLTRQASVAEGSQSDYAQGQFVVTGEIGPLRFRSSTGYTSQDLLERYDATAPGDPPRLFIQSNDTEMFANETRLWQPLGDSVGWVVGASYTRNRMRLTRQLEDRQTSIATTVTGVRNGIDELTVYGEGSLRLLDSLVLTGGTRYTRSKLNGRGEDILPSLEAALARVTAGRTETAFLPSASLLAEVLPDTQLYVRYQESFRPGGLAVEGPVVRRFDNDHSATFEIGARHGSRGRGPFDVAASVSYTRWNQIQADFIDVFGFPSTANIGNGQVWTATLNGGFEVDSRLRLDAGVSWNHSNVDEPQLAFAARVTQVPNIAAFTGRLGFDYLRQLSGDLALTAQGWLNYVGKSRLGIGPELGELQGDYLDSGLTVRVGRPEFGVTFGVTNIADVQGNRFALGTPFAIGRDQVTPLRPRTIRLGFDAAF